MSNTDRIKIVQDIQALISSWQGWKYNIPDLMLESLYIQAVKRKNKPSTLRARIKHKIFLIKSLVKSKIWKTKLPVRKSDVVLVATTIAHLHQMEPVARELKKNNISCFWIVTRKKVASELSQRKEEFFLANGQCLINPLEKSNLLNCIKDLFQNINIDSEHCKIWQRHVRIYLNETLGLIRIFETSILNLNPKILLVGNDLTLEGRIASAVFRKSNLFTACIQHGEVSGLLDAFHTVDTFFVYGVKAAASLAKINNKTNFIVAGAPYLDNLNVERGIDNSIKRTLSIVRPYILVAFSGSGNNTSEAHHRLQIESVYRLAIHYPNYNIIIKLHPKDRERYYQSPLDLTVLPNVRVVKFDHPDFPRSIFDWLKGCMVLITGASTVSIEAMSLNIPVVTLDLKNEYSNVEFIAENTTFNVTNVHDLLFIMDELLINSEAHGEIRKRAVQYAGFYFFKDKKSTAAERIVKEIIQKAYNT